MTPITPRGKEINMAAARPMDAIGVARTMLRSAYTASLATLDPGGYPYSTAINIATDGAGLPYFFAANLSLHARNMAEDERISVTIADMSRDVMTTPRLCLVGRAVLVPREEFDELARPFAARFPKAKLYLSLPDALLYRVVVEGVQLNGGPAQNANNVQPADLFSDLMSAF
jgi:heme iron utilization protein